MEAILDGTPHTGTRNRQAPRRVLAPIHRHTQRQAQRNRALVAGCLASLVTQTRTLQPVDTQRICALAAGHITLDQAAAAFQLGQPELQRVKRFAAMLDEIGGEPDPRP